MTVVTRFAPSPTGSMHIGSARTALFNWLYARHHGGKFLLRIEDTDRTRSTQESIDDILNGLEWLGLTSDEPPHYQSEFADHHAKVVQQLLDQGKAYKCYCTHDKLQQMRDEATAAGRSPKYDGRCRNRAEENLPFAVRFKAPQEGSTVIQDLAQGDVKVENDQLDDMVLLRTDGSPVYMLSVVVDDHDMKITHIIRGVDHLTNSFRQLQLYHALEWTPPKFLHIPLIHGTDGTKLSKRHGALGVMAYKEMGILPEALLNYLLRLGWSHGDEEIISLEQAIKWFDSDGIGRSPARFDMDKLTNLSGIYIRDANDEDLVNLISPSLGETEKARLLAGMSGLKTRAKTLLELADNAAFYTHPRPLPINEKAGKLLDDESKNHLRDFTKELEAAESWEHDALEQAARVYAEKSELKLGKLAQPLRAALTGSTISPSVFEVMEVLGKTETMNRITDVI